MNRLRCVSRQRGVVLVVAMLLLLVLTILGTTGLVTAVLELRMAANARYQARAFRAAEYGIQQAVHATGLATTITLASPRLEPAAGAPLRVPGSPQDSYSYRLYYDTSTPPPSRTVLDCAPIALVAEAATAGPDAVRRKLMSRASYRS